MHVRTPIKVRYGETDMMGVVYHANYLLYFEDARIDFLNTVGASYAAIEDAGYMSPIHDIDVIYGTPPALRRRRVRAHARGALDSHENHLRAGRLSRRYGPHDRQTPRCRTRHLLHR